MPDEAELRRILHDNLKATIRRVNSALRGKGLAKLTPALTRLGRGGQLPHWFQRLRAEQSLPNLDGKTIGSVVEMLLVAVIETSLFDGLGIPPLRINPARGVDLPDLGLGVKSPSENFCTSEPFFSAYERLLGTEHDVLVLLTDYQQAKSQPPLKLQIIQSRYLKGSQVADVGLCRIARKHREWLVRANEAWARKVFKFLAYVNQSDWQAKRLLKMVDEMQDEKEVCRLIDGAGQDFERQNAARLRRDRMPIPTSDLDTLHAVLDVRPIHLGVIDAADNWVVQVQKDLGRVPNDNEWQRLLTSPLDGLIGMSFALQWRYNFGRLFGSIDGDRDSDTSEPFP
ncbi:MAG TPA: hypothetical protein VND64_22130 [Pirellulales bacterium]|nr:hypothetical protein [Pirellulales bacterium]